MSVATDVRFTLDDAQQAADAWGFNCGPGALCAVLGMTPDEIRQHLGDFERKRYTNPTLMASILRGLNVPYKQVWRSDSLCLKTTYPTFGLVRLQWGGPWTEAGVPMRARYRHTHWVAMRNRPGALTEVFDINAMCAGGWIDRLEWQCRLVPWLLKEAVPRANGEFWPTHCWEIER